MYKLKEIALHITDSCTHSCPMCYATKEDVVRQHGDLLVLKKIVFNAIKNGVEKINLVGGDPCDYPHMVELLLYIKEVGEMFNRPIGVSVLSNTHIYRVNNTIIPIEEIVPLISSLEVTLHGPTPSEHDAFCRRENAYNDVMSQLQIYDALRNKEEQGLGIVVNMMPQTASKMYMIAGNAKEKLNIDYFMIQRIAPSGRACSKTCFAINNNDLDTIMNAIARLSESFPETEIVFCDTVPYCAVDDDKRKFLLKGGCNWGEEILAVRMNGDITRCAMGANVIGNFLVLDSHKKFKTFWEKNVELNNTRNRLHLRPKCFECKHYELCRGGCVMAGMIDGQPVGDPYSGCGECPTIIEDNLAAGRRR